MDQLVGWTIQDGVANVPEMLMQPVASRVVAETLADVAEEPEIENGRITEVAGPREERLADAAAALLTSRGDSVEVRESRESVLVPNADDPDARGLRGGRRVAQPGREARRPELRGVARGELGQAGSGHRSSGLDFGPGRCTVAHETAGQAEGVRP